MNRRTVKKGNAEDRVYEPKEKWKERGVDFLMTIGFGKGYGYLALALESFLISRLNPRYNINKPGSVGK